MADNKGNAEIPTGKKIEGQEAKKLDPAKMGVGLAGRPQAAEVEGQDRYWRWCQCPWCGAALRIWYDTDRYLWYQCGNCGGYFRA
jgi:hypothetical protein